MRFPVRDAFTSMPRRLIRGAPAILLGVILNTFDAVSTGLLVFPSTEAGSAFSNLQVQSMSLYIMSTITCQIALTFGGSLFPGALGSMLIEILPFLRGIASSIQKKLGDSNPNLLPTVMAAYTLTSFLVGAIFIALAVFRCGRLVEYFPRTVLRGAIGAIGLSLFCLGLELTVPPSAPTLALSSAGPVLFNSIHLPLLFASVLPALFLSISIRMTFLARVTRGFTDHALYVPVYIMAITGIFWAVAAGTGHADSEGLERLSASGWLFTVQESVRHQKGLGRSFNYWSLFDFKRVEWRAMTAAIQDIVLLVVIGVLNLPIYIPAMALSLDMPSYDMNHELFGHGLANLFAGITGTIPNLVVLSNTRFFTLAGGGRFEGVVVIFFSVILFFVSSALLPYVPTILASTLVLFLGIELMAEALWLTLETLLWSEYAVVLGTLLSCTFIGFLPGFGVGITIEVFVHFMWGLVDTPVRSSYTNNIRTGNRKLAIELPTDVAESESFPGNSSTSSTNDLSEKGPDEEGGYSITVVELTGYVFFANIPSLERKLKLPPISKTSHYVVVDLEKVHRIETSVVEFLERKIREYAANYSPAFIMFSGVRMGSGMNSDLLRGGIECRWMDGLIESANGENGTMTFTDVRTAIAWVKHSEGDTDTSNKSIMDELRRMTFGNDSVVELSDSAISALLSLQVIEDLGLIVQRPNVGDLIISEDKPLSSIFFVVRGTLAMGASTYPGSAGTIDIFRASVKKSLSEVPRRLTVLGRRNFRRSTMVDEEAQSQNIALTERLQLRPGDFIGITEYASGTSNSQPVRVVGGPCCLLEVPTSNITGVEWAMKIYALTHERRKNKYRAFVS